MDRNTETKSMILKAFKKGYTPTAEELLQKLREAEPNFSRATLYRNLASFCENGKLKKVSVVGKTDRYELNTGCNYHLVCEVCGKIEDLEMAGAIKTPARLMDYEVHSHELMFYGVCPKCQKKKK